MTLIIFSSLSAEISLIISAPSFKESSATFDLRVSTDIPISGNFSLNSLITGITLDISSSSSTGSAPGLVDSPPTSNQSAPF